MPGIKDKVVVITGSATMCYTVATAFQNIES
jgi:hypothetical protein